MNCYLMIQTKNIFCKNIVNLKICTENKPIFIYQYLSWAFIFKKGSRLEIFARFNRSTSWLIATNRYRKVPSSRPVYYSILETFDQRSQYISIKFPLHKHFKSAWVCYLLLPRQSTAPRNFTVNIFLNSQKFDSVYQRG